MTYSTFTDLPAPSGDEDDVPCDFCGEGDGPHDDVVTQVVQRREGAETVIKNGHYLCAEDAGFELG